MIYFLSNYDVDRCPFLVNGLRKRGLDTVWVRTPENHPGTVNHLIGAYRAMKRSRKGDVILCWLDIQGVMCYWIGWLLMRHRHIVAINIRLKDKKTLKNRFAAWMYGRALKSKWVMATVTSMEYGRAVTKRLGVEYIYPLVRDVNLYSGYERDFSDNGRRIFCGGNNSRDWGMAVEVAARLPEFKFLLVMPDMKLAERYKPMASKNVKIRYNIPYDSFMNAIHSATFSLLPLDTEAPAGLIVMFQSAWEGRLVFTNSTQTTREYIGTDHGVMLESPTAEDYADSIRYYYEHQDEAAAKVRDFQKFLHAECSGETMVDGLAKVITTMLK